jgi:NADH:ubiquinone oxidoreductase subunit H
MIEKLTVSAIVLFLVGWLLVTQSLVCAGGKASVVWFCSIGFLFIFVSIIAALISMRLDRAERIDQERTTSDEKESA